MTIHIKYLLQNNFNVDEINIQINEKIFKRKNSFRSNLFFKINFNALNCQFNFDSNDFLMNNILRSKLNVYSKFFDDSFNVFFENFITRFAHFLIIHVLNFFHVYITYINDIEKIYNNIYYVLDINTITTFEII